MIKHEDTKRRPQGAMEEILVRLLLVVVAMVQAAIGFAAAVAEGAPPTASVESPLRQPPPSQCPKADTADTHLRDETAAARRWLALRAPLQTDAPSRIGPAAHVAHPSALNQPSRLTGGSATKFLHTHSHTKRNTRKAFERFFFSLTGCQSSANCAKALPCYTILCRRSVAVSRTAR